VTDRSALEAGDAPVAAPADPFPREQFAGLVGHLPRYLRLAWGLAGEPRLSRTRKAGVLAAAAYLASPVDAIPGIIPLLGQLDDLAVALLALRAAVRALDPETRERQLVAAGLAPDDLDRDLGALAAIAAWLARRGVAIGSRLARLVVAASVAAGRAGARTVRHAAPAAGRAAAGAASNAVPAVARAGGRVVRAGGSAVAATAGRGLARVRTHIRGQGPGADADDAARLDAGSGI
jgi:uncharacterized membrane protein YkvA (DUF1232 family)